MEKQHYFNFCFMYFTDNGNVAYESVQNNFVNKNITVNKINNTKREAEIKQYSILISCSYLGYMTYDEFMG